MVLKWHLSRLGNAVLQCFRAYNIKNFVSNYIIVFTKNFCTKEQIRYNTLWWRSESVNFYIETNICYCSAHRGILEPTHVSMVIEESSAFHHSWIYHSNRGFLNVSLPITLWKCQRQGPCAPRNTPYIYIYRLGTWPISAVYMLRYQRVQIASV